MREESGGCGLARANTTRGGVWKGQALCRHAAAAISHLTGVLGFLDANHETAVMSALPLLLSLFVVDFLAAVSPGPAFVGITQIAARHGTRAGLAAVGGLIVSGWIYCALVLSGLTILFELVPWLYFGVRVAGGLYLVWIGVQFLSVRGGSKDEAAAGPAPLPIGRGFRRGLLIGLTNPKAMVYFASVFTLFLKPDAPLWLAIAAVAIVTFDIAIWYGFVGVLFSRPRMRQLYDRLRSAIERTAGVVMVAFGLRLVLSSD